MINVYARPTALSNVCDRVDYVTSSERQENLVATYSTVDSQFWHELAAHCKKQASEAGHRKACEGREWHAALPNVYADIYKGREEELAKELSELFEAITGTKNVVGLHWNESMTNFHFHAVCSENKEINQVTYGAVLTRNTYYNAEGKRSTKKECVDENGNLKNGCAFYEKGTRIETVQRFGAKEFLRDWRVNHKVKQALADKFNQDLHKNIYQVYQNDGIHLKTQKVGKYTPEDIKREIEAKNELVASYNAAVDELMGTTAAYRPELLQKCIAFCRSIRNEIKKYKMTDKWLKAVRHFMKQIKEKTKEISAQVKIALQEEPESLPMSLEEKIKQAQNKTPQKPSGEHVHTFRDNQK